MKNYHDSWIFAKQQLEFFHSDLIPIDLTENNLNENVSSVVILSIQSVQLHEQMIENITDI